MKYDLLNSTYTDELLDKIVLVRKAVNVGEAGNPISSMSTAALSKLKNPLSLITRIVPIRNKLQMLEAMLEPTLQITFVDSKVRQVASLVIALAGAEGGILILNSINSRLPLGEFVHDKTWDDVAFVLLDALKDTGMLSDNIVSALSFL